MLVEGRGRDRNRTGNGMRGEKGEDGGERRDPRRGRVIHRRGRGEREGGRREGGKSDCTFGRRGYL